MHVKQKSKYEEKITFKENMYLFHTNYADRTCGGHMDVVLRLNVGAGNDLV